MNKRTKSNFKLRQDRAVQYDDLALCEIRFYSVTDPASQAMLAAYLCQLARLPLKFGVIVQTNRMGKGMDIAFGREAVQIGLPDGLRALLVLQKTGQPNQRYDRSTLLARHKQ